ncbi:MAG TPA: hypothetical protein VMW91_02995 [Desulfosporosinus sp.]|nr:hypothetical protein [Desulfosporosinus sp.]
MTEQQGTNEKKPGVETSSSDKTRVVPYEDYIKLVNDAREQITWVRKNYGWMVLPLVVVFVGIIAYFMGDWFVFKHNLSDTLDKTITSKIELKLAESNMVIRIQDAVDKEVTKVIDSTLQTKVDLAVNTTVKQEVSKTAPSLIKQEVDESVLPLALDEVERMMERMMDEEILPSMRKQYDELSNLSDLIIRAQFGDRNAFDVLNKMVSEPIAERVIVQIAERYNSAHVFSYDSWYLADISDEEVVRRLKSKKIAERKLAVVTVKKRSSAKMYSQIPLLISMIDTEDDLGVLTAIVGTLNTILGSSQKVLPYPSKAKYEKLWKEKKDKLLNK